MPDGGPRPLWGKGITRWQLAQSRMAPEVKQKAFDDSETRAK